LPLTTHDRSFVGSRTCDEVTAESITPTHAMADATSSGTLRPTPHRLLRLARLSTCRHHVATAAYTHTHALLHALLHPSPRTSCIASLLLLPALEALLRAVRSMFLDRGQPVARHLHLSSSVTTAKYSLHLHHPSMHSYFVHSSPPMQLQHSHQHLAVDHTCQALNSPPTSSLCYSGAGKRVGFAIVGLGRAGNFHLTSLSACVDVAVLR
jgi:hypothetical protein